MELKINSLSVKDCWEILKGNVNIKELYNMTFGEYPNDEKMKKYEDPFRVSAFYQNIQYFAYVMLLKYEELLDDKIFSLDTLKYENEATPRIDTIAFKGEVQFLYTKNGYIVMDL